MRSEKTLRLQEFLYLRFDYSSIKLVFAALRPWLWIIPNKYNNSIKRRLAIKIIAFFVLKPFLFQALFAGLLKFYYALIYGWHFGALPESFAGTF